MPPDAGKEQQKQQNRRRVKEYAHEKDASSTPAGTLARQAVGLGDARTLRRYLESSIDDRAFVTSAAVDAQRGW